MGSPVSTLDTLIEPGRLLVFIDDGGTPERPLPNLVRDFALAVAVVIRSDDYPRFLVASAASLASVAPPPSEFHATEVVNPRSGTALREIGLDTRRHLFAEWCSLLAEFGTFLPYAFIGSEQYAEMRRSFTDRGIPVTPSHRESLHHVFLTCMFERVASRSGGEELVVIADNMDSRQNCVVEWSHPRSGAYLGRIHYMPSHLVQGIQLADLLAYLMNRVYHRAHRRRQGRPCPFEDICGATMKQLDLRLHDVLLPEIY